MIFFHRITEGSKRHIGFNFLLDKYSIDIYFIIPIWRCKYKFQFDFSCEAYVMAKPTQYILLGIRWPRLLKQFHFYHRSYQILRKPEYLITREMLEDNLYGFTNMDLIKGLKK